jgi:AAHS family 4-hydroxybenzoate transporter-like MFS transporter
MPASLSTDSSIDIVRLLDEGPLARVPRWLVAGAALTVVFDGIDNQLLGIVIPSLMHDWALPRSAFAPVVSMGYLGMAMGGAAGLLGDRVGRKRSLIGCMVLFAIMTMAAGTASGITWLIIVRWLAGLGLGGAMPNATALVAEYVPRRQRPLAITMTIVCVPVGGTIAGLLGVRLLPSIGWQQLFALSGGLTLVVALILMICLAESPRFLAGHRARWPQLVRVLARLGHVVPADAGFLDEPQAERRRGARVGVVLGAPFIRDTLALWAAFFFCLLAVYLGFSWLTSLLASARFAAAANSGITAFNLGGVAGAVLGGAAIVRFGSRLSMLVMAAGGVVGAAALGLLQIDAGVDPLIVLVLLAFTGASINATQTTMFALAAHIYPSQVRATGVGLAVGIGRLGAIVSGYAGAAALDWGSSHAFFGAMAMAMLASLIALAIVSRHVVTEAGRERS